MIFSNPGAPPFVRCKPILCSFHYFMLRPGRGSSVRLHPLQLVVLTLSLHVGSVAVVGGRVADIVSKRVRGTECLPGVGVVSDSLRAVRRQTVLWVRRSRLSDVSSVHRCWRSLKYNRDNNISSASDAPNCFS